MSIFLPNESPIFQILTRYAQTQNVILLNDFWMTIKKYINSLKTKSAQINYPQLQKLNNLHINIIVAVIGFNAITLAKRQNILADASIVFTILDELKDPDRHEPKDPDDTCRKTAALRIMDNMNRLRDSLPFRI